MRPVRSSAHGKRKEPRSLAALVLFGCLLVARADPGAQRVQDERLHGPYNHWTFELATADAPKLTAENLDERIAYHVEQARKYSTMAAELPAQVAAFNAAAAYLQPIKRSIDTAMLYAGI